MPTLKKKITLSLGRNTSLLIDLETGVTGLDVSSRGLRSRLGKALARLRKGAPWFRAARPPNGKPGLLARDRARPKPARILGSDTPVFFVTGLGKSGTSWLMRTLDSHPEILCKGEGRFFAAGWRRTNFDPEGTRALASSLYYALLDSE